MLNRFVMKRSDVVIERIRIVKIQNYYKHGVHTVIDSEVLFQRWTTWNRLDVPVVIELFSPEGDGHFGHKSIGEYSYRVMVV